MHGLPLLVHAIAAGQEQLAEMLVLHGAEVDAVDGGSPPLLLASQAGRPSSSSGEPGYSNRLLCNPACNSPATLLILTLCNQAGSLKLLQA